MKLRRRELLVMLLTGVMGCSSDSKSSPGVTAEASPLTTQTLDARRQTEEETPDARRQTQEETPDARRQTPIETVRGSTTQAPRIAKELPVKVVEVIGREGWGAAEAGPGLVEHSIERLTIHHTGVELGDNRQAPARLRAHQEFHQKDRGWPDLAYHFAIDREGNIYEGRSTNFRGDTATSYDPTGHFLVVLEGNFDIERPADPQVQSLTDLLAWATDRYAVDVDTIKSHRDYAPDETSCPGANLYALLQSGALLEMVQSVFDGGRQELVYLRGADARERVAAIAQGR